MHHNMIFYSFLKFYLKSLVNTLHIFSIRNGKENLLFEREFLSLNHVEKKREKVCGRVYIKTLTLISY